MTSASEWTVSRSTRRCAATGRDIAEGETHYAALREEGERFLRADYSADAWEGVDRSGLYSWWKTKLAPVDCDRRRRRLRVDVEAFYGFFTGLEGSEALHRRRLRYVLALVLARKRALRLDDTAMRPEGEALLLYDRRAGRTIEVSAPGMTSAEIEETEEELSRLFDSGGDGLEGES